MSKLFCASICHIRSGLCHEMCGRRVGARRVSLCILLFYCIYGGTAISQVQDSVELANAAFEQQRYDVALHFFENFGDTLAHREEIAYCYYKLGRYQEAEPRFLLLLEADSTDLSSHLYLGTIYESSFNYPKAIKHYHRLCQLDSTNGHYIKMLAQVYEKANLPSQALKLYEEAHALNTSDLVVLLQMADIHLRNKEYAVADSLADLALALDSTNLRVLLTKARSTYSLKDYPRAIECVEATRGRLDLVPFYQKMLGYAYLQVDSLDKAIHVLTNLLYEEQSEYTYSYLARAHALRGDVEKAKFFYEHAIKAGLSANLEQYHLALARLATVKGKLKDASAAYEEAFRYGGNPVCIYYKAQACEGFYADKQIAINQYKRYIRLSPENDRFRSAANERIRLLREYIHQSAGNE